jgi:hypothetical protein
MQVKKLTAANFAEYVIEENLPRKAIDTSSITQSAVAYDYVNWSLKLLLEQKGTIAKMINYGMHFCQGIVVVDREDRVAASISHATGSDFVRYFLLNVRYAERMKSDTQKFIQLMVHELAHACIFINPNDEETVGAIWKAIRKIVPKEQRKLSDPLYKLWKELFKIPSFVTTDIEAMNWHFAQIDKVFAKWCGQDFAIQDSDAEIKYGFTSFNEAIAQAVMFKVCNVKLPEKYQAVYDEVYAIVEKRLP